MKLHAAIVILGIALLLFTGRSYGQDKPVSRSEVEQIIREYILQHPELLMESVRGYQEREQIAAQQRSREAIAAKHRELFEDKAAPVSGKADAKVTIVQFFDYNCGYCRRVTPTVVKLLEENQDVRMIFKEMPILGPDSHLAARAALAAQKQDAYFKFHRALMDLKSPSTATAIEETGRKLGLDVARLKTDMDSPEIQAILAKNQQLAAALGVQSTPSFVIGNELVPGAMDLAGFQALIAKAGEKSATKPATSAPPTDKQSPRP
jgi:protein-disulfide isomerase